MADPKDYDTLDLHHAPMSIATLVYLVSMLHDGHPVMVVNAKGGETGEQFVHRLELSIIAAHEARVRTARERERERGTLL